MAAGARFRADWVLPIAEPPIKGGWVAVSGGRIRETGNDATTAVDLGHVALLPGLVNAHTHLELSYLRGQVDRASSLPEWVRAQLRIRRHAAPPEGVIPDAIANAIVDARASGTVLFGDVANTLATVPALAAAGASARVFYELIGFGPSDPAARVREARAQVSGLAPGSDDVRVSLAPHAPYSVSPELFREIRRDLDRHDHDVSSVHLAESPEEVEFLARGTGPWRALLEEFNAWNPTWLTPGSSPVAYLDDLGVLDARMLAVHGVQCDGEDLRRLRARGVTMVSCPRSNAYVGVGAPPIELFYAMGVDVAFGTDSLASTDTLNMFDELAAARALAPRVPASALLRSATATGAKALGFGSEFGTLEAGKRAEIIAVRVPADVEDVEEYLVSGVSPADVSWLNSEL